VVNERLRQSSLTRERLIVTGPRIVIPVGKLNLTGPRAVMLPPATIFLTHEKLSASALVGEHLQ
jgi:hypothetical protein